MGSASKVASVGALLSADDDHLKEIVSLISQETKIDAAAQRQSCDLDDDLEISNGEPLPICVFGGTSTLQVAKAATSEIKEALVRIIGKGPTEIKPNVTRNTMLMFNKLLEDPKFQSAVASIASDSSIRDAVMKNHVVNEYMKSANPSLKMISSVTEIVGGLDSICHKPVNNSSLIEKLADLSQNVKVWMSVVASVADDTNIWDAVMKNPVVSEYKKSTIPSIKMISSDTEFVCGLDFICDEPLKNSSLIEKLTDLVKDLSQNVKTRVFGMVSSLSNRLYNRFGTSSAVHDDHSIHESSFMNDYESAAMCALLVIVLLLLK